MEAKLPNRQSIRMKGWDYTASGWYFVTFNARENKPIFGTIVNGRMVLNEAGRVAGEEWQKSAFIRDGIELDEFVVMPNHVHGIVRITTRADGPGNLRQAQFGKPVAGALGTFVGAYKAAVSREINRRRGMMHHAPRVWMHQTRPLMHHARPLMHPARPQLAAGASAIWHRNYWDVIVRDEKALGNIRHYIRNNPRNYDAVMNVAKPQFLGNPALLKMPKMGFLASRGKDTPHGRLPMKKGEAILSGFLSPMERAVFKASLEYKKPLIWVKPWGLADNTASAAVRLATEEGRLLIVSPFDDNIDAPAVRRAAWCNQYVLAHCDRMVVGHLNPDGMLACVLSEAAPDKELVYL